MTTNSLVITRSIATCRISGGRVGGVRVGGGRVGGVSVRVVARSRVPLGCNGVAGMTIGRSATGFALK